MNTILLIEDDEQVVTLYKEALSTAGFSVHAVPTGKEGLQAVTASKPNLVILDIMLPGGMNGFDVLEQMKADRELKIIPVIVLTNLDSEKKVALKIGASDYLVKANTTIDQVISKVKQYTQ